MVVKDADNPIELTLRLTPEDAETLLEDAKDVNKLTFEFSDYRMNQLREDLKSELKLYERLNDEN